MTLAIPPSESVRAAVESELLKPYVPRLVIEWLRSTPDALHRELEATLVFADISGFTGLTERLAKKGKIGAELMRDTLDGVFRALLDEAYDWGAGLLKWGGDALLLLFDGPDHENRACRAAWEMQRTIDRVGRLHLSGGTLILRMSVGIGTGRFHFFMTGSVHRELLIAGPTETHLSNPVLARLGFTRSRYPVYPIAQLVAEKLHALTLPRDVENTRARDLVDLVWFAQNFSFHSVALIEACVATFEHRATHAWPPSVPAPPTSWRKRYERWRAELVLSDATPEDATSAVRAFLDPVLAGIRGRQWEPETRSWNIGH
jgi:hypothetical protein